LDSFHKSAFGGHSGGKDNIEEITTHILLAQYAEASENLYSELPYLSEEQI
jgi:hypothetical protein